MDLGLDGRVYLLTGASRGLGLATGRELVADGAKVVLVSRDGERAAAAAGELGASQAVGIAGDLADPHAAGRMVATALARWERLDGALISVGGPPPGKVADIDDDTWRAAFESVFLGGLRVARTVADSLSDGGSIALVLSTSVKSPVSGLATSNGLRPGLGVLAKQLADELGPRGIRVNGLLPGRVDTERVQELDGLAGDPAAARAASEAAIPLGRYGRPEEFGKVAAFVLSPAASYLTGAMIPVEGGALRSL